MSANSVAAAPVDVPAAAVATRKKSSFSLAFRVLPPEQRVALDALYGFCRAVDDAADDAPTPEAASRGLSLWRRALDDIYADAPPRDGAARATRPAPGGESPEATGIAELTGPLRAAVRAFSMRRENFEMVIEGCAWDVTRRRYATWNELREYCLRVASAVGLSSIEIFGCTSEVARGYAIDLGLALQLTNIIRDVEEDAARGRIYLPGEDLAAFGVAERDLLEPAPGAPWPPSVQRLLEYEARRAHEHYERAHAALQRLDRSRLPAAEIMGDVYFALLQRIEKQHFPRGRAALPTATKLGLLLRRLAIHQLRRLFSRRHR